MESSGLGSFLRSRKFGSYFDPSFSSNSYTLSKVAAEKVVENKSKSDVYVDDDDDDDDDDGWLSVMISWLRIVVCFVVMMITTSLWALIMLLLLPWPYQRIRQGNILGHVTGRILMWIVGNPVKIEGAEYSNERAIYICNHASPIDIVLVMWLTPTGTVGIAKKEVCTMTEPNPSPKPLLREFGYSQETRSWKIAVNLHKNSVRGPRDFSPGKPSDDQVSYRFPSLKYEDLPLCE